MEELRKAMTSFGFMIIQTLVTDIEPDMKVRAAMNEINAAQRLRYANLTSAISPFTSDPLSANVLIPQRSRDLKSFWQLVQDSGSNNSGDLKVTSNSGVTSSICSQGCSYWKSGSWKGASCERSWSWCRSAQVSTASEEIMLGSYCKEVGNDIKKQITIDCILYIDKKDWHIIGTTSLCHKNVFLQRPSTCKGKELQGRGRQ